VLPSHTRYEFSMIDRRPVYDWPGGKRLAFYIGTNVEYFAFGAGTGSDPAFGSAARQTQRNYAWRDYGHRVGLWRLFDLFDELKLPAAHNLSSLICDYRPEIVARMRARGDEIIGHGRTQSERQGSMWEADEARMVAEATATIEAAYGRRPYGWMGPGMSHTPATIDVLQEAGYKFVMDWCCDDQPFWMKARKGRILCVPYSLEVNDSVTLLFRHQTARDFADMIVDQFDEMIEQCEREPLVCNISIHPYVFGQPFRLRPLRAALKHCLSHRLKDRLWVCKPEDISEFCYALPPGVIPGG
jgi:allantoinase